MTYQKDTIIFEPFPTTWNFLDRTNTAINDLKILGYAGKSATKEPKTQWFVECHCGKVFIAIGSNLGNGTTKSCGCISINRIGALNRSHQLTHTRTYRIWAGMKTRCTNANNPNYKRYGERGITICERWLHSFEHFLADMGHCPSNKHTIERRDNNGNYEPTNCYWEPDWNVQVSNTRRNVFVTFQNKTQTVSQWAREIGMNSHLLRDRLKRGWTMEDAIALPLQKSRHWTKRSSCTT